MLVEFSVSNYKSIKEKQTLSLVAKKNNNHVFETGYAKVPFLLKRVAILGPNASGKSNMLNAMYVAKNIIRLSYKYENNEKMPLEPYLLDNESAKNPCEFEFIFTHNDAVYQYGFSANKDEIFEEWLYVTHKKGNLQRWLERGNNSNKDSWYINPIIKGRRKEWIAEARPNTLLLSLIGTYKNQELLKPIQYYLTNDIKFLPLAGVELNRITMKVCHEDNEIKTKVLDFLKQADLSIDNFRIETETFSLDKLPADLPSALREELERELKGQTIFSAKTSHEKEDGTYVEFELQQESSGTQILFDASFPIIDALQKGRVLVIDEINTSIHFKELEFIENLFNNPEINKNGAQIIFTTHDISVLRRLHREEIYFTDKIKGFHTQLYPLTDFENRGDSSIYNRYVDGLYFALPKITESI